MIRIKDAEDGNNVNEIANYFIKKGCAVKQSGKFIVQR